MGVFFDLRDNFRLSAHFSYFKPLASGTNRFGNSGKPIYHLEYRKNPHACLSDAPPHPQIHF